MSLAIPPRYVPRWNDQAFAPPYLQEGCILYGFFPRCDRQKLQVLCNRYLVEPSQGQVQAEALDHVLLYFCGFARSQSLHDQDRLRGSYGENECGLWIPLWLRSGRAAPRLAFLPLSLYVDSGPAAISGRELLGFPKELGHITLPLAGEPPGLFALDALLRVRDGADQQARWARLIEVRARAATRPVRSLLPRPLLRLLLAALRRRPAMLPLILLKQIRDAVDPDRACHQSILSCRSDLQALRSLRVLPGTYDIALTPCVSHPLAELGIAPAALRGLHGFAVDFDFILGLESVLWEAT